MYSPQRYLEEKYDVVVGSPTNVALCTCWTDPALILKQAPETTEHFSLIGTLYSREGVSIILRNLCLNPDIDTIVMWAHNPLSNTAIGSAGRTLLRNLWEYGVGDDNTVENTPDKVHKEIARDIIETVRKNVTLIDASDLEIQNVLIEAKKLKKKKRSFYMRPQSFPAPVRDTSRPMPSEKAGWSVRGTTLTAAWVRVVDKIVRYGTVKNTESGSLQKELQSVTWTIEKEDPESLMIPDWPDTLKSQIGLNPKILNQYKTIFIDPKKPEGTAYTYGNRLNNYLGKIDQVQEMIDKLKDTPISRRAYASTFYPPEDLHNASPPCLSSIQILAGDDHRLNMFASFRSHDIFKAAIPNAFGLLNLQRHIAHETGYTRGTLTITSVSAHIYEEDWNMATDTVKCALWESGKLYFDENEDIDPRGTIRIALKNDHILVEMTTQDGDVLFEYAGRTAREVAYKIARLDLLSMPTHYADVTIELVKAELALKNGLPYTQDRPLILGKTVIK